MLNEERDLLIKEVCARLPYGVKCKFEDKVYDILGFAHGRVMLCLPFMSNTITTPIENIELYLLPLSSMNEEQKREYNKWKHYVPTYHYEYGDIVEEVELFDSVESFEYLIENHFDYRGIIGKGNVKDATNLNIY